MSIQLEKAKKLYRNNNYQKAKPILKKINKKQPSTDSLMLEAYCHFYSKNFIETLTTLKKLDDTKLESAQLDKLKLEAASYINLNKGQEAIKTYKKALSIDDSFREVATRKALCDVAMQVGDYDTVFEYGQKLVSISEYSEMAYCMLFMASIFDDNQAKKLQYRNLIKAHSAEFNEESIIKLVNTLKQQDLKVELTDILAIFKDKFAHTSWHQDALIFATLENVQQQHRDELIIESDKAVIKEKIKQLIEQNTKLGGFFHPSLRINETNGNLSISSDMINNKFDTLISIPTRCMPILSDYDLSLTNKNTKLHAKLKESAINPSAAPTMQSLIEIYNLCNKVEDWCKSSPFILLKDHPKLLKSLTSLKPLNLKFQKLLSITFEETFEKLILETFFASRVFNYSSKSLGLDGENNYQGLLSIIDFLNHHPRARGYAMKNNSVEINSARLEPDNHEVFVRYNNFDSITSFLIYGYLDTSSEIFNSLPCSLNTLKGIKINIQGNTASRDREALDDSQKHTQSYMPEAKQLNQVEITLDKLVIPLNMHNSNILRDAFIKILNTHSAMFGTQFDIEKEISFLEKQLLIANNQALYSFKTHIKNHQGDIAKETYDLLINFVDINLAQLNSYCINNAVTLI